MHGRSKLLAPARARSGRRLPESSAPTTAGRASDEACAEVRPVVAVPVAACAPTGTSTVASTPTAVARSAAVAAYQGATA